MPIRLVGRAACALATLSALSLAAAEGAAQTPPVVGLVQDSTGTPLPNAQVAVTALQRGTSTDAAGRFALRGLPAGTQHLDVVLIGYAPAHSVVEVPASGDSVRVTVVMRATPLRLTGVQVTATPVGADALNITQSTLELSGQALARNLGASVAQTLSGEPGLATRYAGPAANSPVVRGLTGERVLVLQDGQRAADLSSVSSDHGVSIDPLTAARIEVVRGPASLLYGNNALGGVVNVISNDIPTTVPGHLEGFIGTQGETVNPGAAITGGLTARLGGSGAFTVRGGGRALDDVRVGGSGRLVNSYSKNVQALAGLGLVKGWGTAGAAYRWYDFEYGLPYDPGGGGEGGVHIEGRRHELSSRNVANLPWRGLSLLRLNGTAQWYAHDEVESTGEVGTRFELKTQTADLTAKTQLWRATGAIGVSGLAKQYSPTGEEALTPSANSDAGGIFLYQEVPFGLGGEAEGRTPRLQLGARYDVFQLRADAGDPARFGPAQSRRFNNYSGSIGVNVPLWTAAAFSVSAARAFRAPTVEELFSNGFHIATATYDEGNAALRSETNQGVDVVLRVQSTRINAQLAGYHNRIERYIAPRATGRTEISDTGEPFPVFRYEQADATIRGLEGQIEAEVAQHLVVGAVGDVLRGRYHDDTPLPFMPAARLGGSVRWDGGRFNTGVEVRHAFAQNDVPAEETAAGGYTLLNLSVGVQLISGPAIHSIVLRADNVTDEAYREATSRIKAFALNPGRNVSAIYRVLF
ncbi:MAG TPA: TonB-dependent receptor [Gemmatimonadaceae bacterium]|nr:TonB-dependent receptor [Gemmatimonadaceae bacterium]